MKKKENKLDLTKIMLNKHVYYKYFIEKEFEAGLSLQGWEIKSLRAGRVNISNSYVVIKNGEAFLFGANFIPLATTISCYIFYDPMRIRKLLLNQRELNSLYGQINCNGYSIVVISLYWKGAWCKVKIGIAKGKKQYDRRTTLKDREWQLNKARIMKDSRC